MDILLRTSISLPTRVAASTTSNPLHTSPMESAVVFPCSNVIQLGCGYLLERLLRDWSRSTGARRRMHYYSLNMIHVKYLLCNLLPNFLPVQQMRILQQESLSILNRRVGPGGKRLPCGKDGTFCRSRSSSIVVW